MNSSGFQLFRMIGFIRFTNIVNCDAVLNSESRLVSLVRELYNKNTSQVDPAVVKKLSSMLEVVIISGFKLHIVDCYMVDDDGEMVFVVMGKIDNVYKMLAYFAFLENAGCDVALVLDSQKVNSFSTVVSTGSYNLSFPDLCIDGEVKYSLRFPHVVTDDGSAAVMGSPDGGKKNSEKVRKFFDSVPDYVKVLTVLQPPPYCFGMFNDVSRLVATVNR